MIDASTKGKQRDKDEKCVFSVKHDQQNEVPQIMIKKCFSEAFSLPFYAILSICLSFLRYTHIFHIHGFMK